MDTNTPAGVEALMLLYQNAAADYHAWLTDVGTSKQWQQSEEKLRTALESLSGGAKPVAWQGRKRFRDGHPGWSRWQEIEPQDMETWERRVTLYPEDFERRPIYTHPPFSAGEAVASEKVTDWTTEDADLNNLLNTVTDIERHGGNMDDGLMLMDFIDKVVARLRPASGEAVAQPVGAEEEPFPLDSGMCDFCRQPVQRHAKGCKATAIPAPLPAAPQVQAVGADKNEYPEAFGKDVDDAVIKMLQLFGYRTTGDALTRARRAYYLMLENRDLISLQKAVIAKLKENAIPAPLPAAPQVQAVNGIPPMVYWAPLAENFYSAEGKGMGTEFYDKWRSRRAEFPQGESWGWGPGSAHNPFKDPPRAPNAPVGDNKE